VSQQLKSIRSHRPEVRDQRHQRRCIDGASQRLSLRQQCVLGPISQARWQHQPLLQIRLTAVGDSSCRLALWSAERHDRGRQGAHQRACLLEPSQKICVDLGGIPGDMGEGAVGDVCAANVCNEWGCDKGPASATLVLTKSLHTRPTPGISGSAPAPLPPIYPRPGTGTALSPGLGAAPGL
jgi:hypothetical protein